MILYLKPYFEKKPWAGKKLGKLFDCSCDTGEAWIVSGYSGKSSVVKNGIYKNKTLRNLWTLHPELFGYIEEKEFPILVKLIDASDDLSVQVHPNDIYALKKHNSLGKYECWYIMNENCSNEIITGISAKTNIEAREYIENGILEEKLIKSEVKCGDLVEINPGCIHALTKGSFVLEVQESSDITYRIYDYNRFPKRELHIEDSLNVVRFNDMKNPVFHLKKGERFCTNYFDIMRLDLSSEKRKISVDTFLLIYVLEGNGEINGEKINKNDIILITNEEKEIIIHGNSSIIVIFPKRKKKSRLKMRKVALITGIVSQDGSYLAEYLLKKGYEVHGLINSKALLNKECISFLSSDLSLLNKFLFFHLGDMTDSSNLNRLIENVRPDEIYHLASQSHVDVSFEIPEYTANVNSLGTLRLIDAIRQNELRTKLFNESTCQLFDGSDAAICQTENTPFNPKTPYATSKAFSHFIVNNYRDAYGIYAVNGIMFTHSSPREDDSFVGRKITKAAANIKLGKQKKLLIGNIYTRRDWGFAGDYVEGMWLSLQQEKPDDYIFASGETHTIKEFIELSFLEVGIDIQWVGEGIKEKGVNALTKDIIVEVDPSLYRMSESTYLMGNATKALNKIGWKNKTSFNELVKMMIDNELRILMEEKK